MHIRRTLLFGALIAGLVYSVAASASAQSDNEIKAAFARVEQTIAQDQHKPPKERQKAFNDAENDLKNVTSQISKDYPANSEVMHHALLLTAELQDKSDPDILSNVKIQAAGLYRKLIAQAGPGALLGHPAKWPDQYVEQAYRDYTALSQAVIQVRSHELLYKIMDALVALTGRNPLFSYWFGIILLTLVVKLVTTPLSHLQFESMRNMQRLQPKIEKLKRDLGDDQREFQKQQWQLLKDNNAMPQWGCLALLVQMPFLYVMYWMIRTYQFQFAHGHFLWIGSRLAERFTFVGASLADPDWTLLILYGLSMYVSTRMAAGAAADKQQQDTQKMMSYLMPAMFVLIFNYFPSAFILYWLILNILTTTQQYFMLNRPVPALALEDEEAQEPVSETALASAVRSPRPRKRK